MRGARLRMSCGIPHDLHFAHQLNTRLRAHRRLHVINHVFDIGGCRGAGIDDEIRMLRRHLRATDRESLQSARFNQACRKIARRITKCRTGVWFVERLRRHALGEQFLDAGLRGRCIARQEAEARGDEPLAGSSLFSREAGRDFRR